MFRNETFPAQVMDEKRTFEEKINALTTLSASELKAMLIEKMTSKIDTGEFDDCQEIKAADGRIFSINFGLRAYKYDKQNNPIEIQIEDGSDTSVKYWESENLEEIIGTEDKVTILRQLIEKNKIAL